METDAWNTPTAIKNQLGALSMEGTHVQVTNHENAKAHRYTAFITFSP